MLAANTVCLSRISYLKGSVCMDGLLSMFGIQTLLFAGLV